MAGATVVMASGCATSFVRSQSTVEPRHVFPATTLDAHVFWYTGVNGEPLFARVDPKDRNSPLARMAYGVGSICDLPFSVAFDTLLLPIDLFRPNPVSVTTNSQPDPDGRP